ncbi:Acetyl-CoA carboxylase, partial [Symbiodinium microadriaticum]
VAFTNVSTEARHLEIQILGDEYGNTLALNGRDCSTQRRFQKIFEEGPPTIAKPDVFHEMERAAMRLTALVSYRGAGTVETDTFCFLELNPRLQATQLQIAMGIPLYNVPDIRRFYGMDPAVCSKIDFFAVDYPPITSHCCASRITAENPDEGFKPTSGKINSVRFQSAGYFSVGLKGGIHEFADSQFGHIFAKGPNREAARSLRFALMNLDISGDIRHPVDYLVDLIETQAYKDNTIDTMWLDGLIASKAISPSTGAMDVVFYAAVFRAFSALTPLGKSDTDALVNFPVELLGCRTRITYDGKKFCFQDVYAFTINNKTLKAKVREQPDGSLYVSIGSISQQVKGQEEALGLRLIIGAQTIMVPTVYDPSELRSDVNGKVVRYLHDEGTEIAKGEAYIELEAMKMIMSGEAGKISHSLSPGAIVSAGEVLANLQLKDPSKVKKIALFDGDFEMSAKPEPDVPAPREADVRELRQPRGGIRDGARRAGDEKYLSNERPFATSIEKKQPYDKLLLDLINQGKDSMEKVLFMVAAHNKLAERSVMALIREMLAAEGSGMSCMYVPDLRLEDDMAGAVQEKIVELSQLPSSAADYGNVRYLAQQLLDTVPQESYEERTKHFREQLAALKEDTVKAMNQERAMHAYLSWLAAPSRLTKVEVLPATKTAVWTQFFPVTAEQGVPINFLHIVVGRDAFPGITDRTLFYNTDSELQQVEVLPATKTAVWTQFFPVTAEQVLKRCQGIFARQAELLKAAGVGEICVALPQPPRHPRFVKFSIDPTTEEWSENEMGRDLWLELSMLQRLYTLQRIHKEVRPTSHIYLATPMLGGKAPTSELLMRALFLSGVSKESFSQSLTDTGLFDSLDVALEEVEHAMLDPRVAKLGPSVTSRIFVHFVSELDMDLAELEQRFTETISSHVGHRGSEVIKLCIDEIEVKVHRRVGGAKETLRLSLSSLNGGFLKPKMLREFPVTGFPLRWEAAKEGAAPLTSLDHPHVTDPAALSRYQAKRVAARRAGSTYALPGARLEILLYDLPGMLQLALTMWIAFTGTTNTNTSPRGEELLTAVELVMDWSKMDLGMLAWKLTMKTPECPEGRVVILIANDVREDQFFQKASELARKLGLPRVYVSCNSGARVGIGVENLQGSGLIAGETSRAYQETFTLSYITGRSVGIGAYLNRLGQRNIQMVSSPMILTGYSALNKLLGKNVYSSQDQLGGPQIMVPNGVTHQVVRDDQEGMSAILDWLSYVPKDVSCLPPVCQPAGADPWDRDVEFEPTQLPYDPRDFLRGVIDYEGNRKRGFFDAGRDLASSEGALQSRVKRVSDNNGRNQENKFGNQGSWTEYLEGWGKTVIVGRARLGGMPMGVIAVETRSVERLVPADPSNPASAEVKELNGGKVWFPDSAFKTAQVLKFRGFGGWECWE